MNQAKRIGLMTLSMLIISTLVIGIVLPKLKMVFYYTMDDSYISFRYAKNLAEHGILSWNLNDPLPVEGYTSFLWVIILAILDVFSADLETWSKYFSIGFVSLSVCALYAWAVLRKKSAFLIVTAIIVTISFLLQQDLLLHMVSGMETSLSILLIALSCICVLYINSDIVNQRTPTSLMLMTLLFLLFLAALCRPEYNLVFVTFMSTLLLKNGSHRPLIFKRVIIPYMIIGFLFFTWRFFYYKMLFPLPFYIKVSSQHFAGMGSVLQFYADTIHVWPLAIVPLFNGVYRRTFSPIFLLILVMSVFFIFPNHIMGTSHRFMIPLLFPICLLAIAGAQFIVNRLPNMTSKFLFIIVYATFTFSIQLTQKRDVIGGMKWYADGMEAAHIKIGKVLATFDSARSVAVGDAGAIPFFSGWNAIDTFGLNNRSIALQRALKLYDTNLVLALRPDLLIIISTDPLNPSHPIAVKHEEKLLKDALSLGYKLITSVRFSHSYFLLLYSREESLGKDILSRLTALEGAR